MAEQVTKPRAQRAADSVVSLVLFVDAAVARVESWALIVALALMIGLGAVHVILRNFFDSGLLWGDVLSRYLVVWVGMLGASLATREGRHIKIDVVGRFLPQRPRYVIALVTDLAAVVLCLLFMSASWDFLADQMEFQEMLPATFPGGLKVPVWAALAILPVAFGGIALRFFIQATKSLWIALGRLDPREHDLADALAAEGQLGVDPDTEVESRRAEAEAGVEALTHCHDEVQAEAEAPPGAEDDGDESGRTGP